MEALIALIVLAPFAGAVLALVAFLRTREVRQLSVRVAALEQELLRLRREQGPAAPAPAPVAPERPAPVEPERPPTRLPPVASDPRTGSVPPPSPPRPAVPVREPAVDAGRGAPHRAAARASWERWIGVRGAAVAGGVVAALACVLFLQHAVAAGWLRLSPGGRVAMGYAVGVGALVLGEVVRRRGLRYVPEAITGAGIVALYAATWAAHSLYDFVPLAPAGALLGATTLLCGWLAARRESALVAGLGLLGGFATPLLLESDSVSAPSLFGYLLVLDAGLLVLARRRGWAWLAALALAGTVAYEATWLGAWRGVDEPWLAVAVLGGGGLVFALGTGGGSGGAGSRLAAATRAFGLVAPLALGLQLARDVRVEAPLPPLLVLLALLAVAADWLAARRGERDVAALVAAGAAALLGAWAFDRALDDAQAWTLCGGLVGLTSIHVVALELERRRGELAPRAELPALVGAFVGLCVAARLAAAAPPTGSWPWIVALAVPAGALVRLGLGAGRGPALVAAGAVSACGLGLLAAGGLPGPVPRVPPIRPLGPELALALSAAGAAAFLAVAWRVRGPRNVPAAHAAAAFAAVLLALEGLGAGQVGGPIGGEAPALRAAWVLVLASALALSDVRAASGAWLAAAVLLAGLVAARPPHAEGAGRAAWELATAGVLALAPLALRSELARRPWAWWAAGLASFAVLPFATPRPDDAWRALPPASLALVTAAGAWVAGPRLRSWGLGEAVRGARVWLGGAAVALAALAVAVQARPSWGLVAAGLAGGGWAVLGTRLRHPGPWVASLGALGLSLAGLLAVAFLPTYRQDPSSWLWNELLWEHGGPLLGALVAARALRAGGARRSAALAGLVAVGVAFLWLNLTVVAAFADGGHLHLRLEQLPARDLALSVAWAAMALVLLVAGTVRRDGALRWASLGLLLATLGKVFLMDLGELEGLYRIGSLLGLAASLLIVSALYQRFVFVGSATDALPDRPAPEDPPGAGAAG